MDICEKICSKCERILPSANFTRRRGKPPRLRSMCEECRGKAKMEREIKKLTSDYKTANRTTKICIRVAKSTITEYKLSSEKILMQYLKHVIKEILSVWLIEWNQRGDSGHDTLFTMVTTGCVKEKGTVFFTSANLKETLKSENIEFTRTSLYKALRKLKAKPTNKTKRFNGIQVRTWEIRVFYFEKAVQTAAEDNAG